MANRITELFKIKYPIIQAGMIWNSGWRLASASSNAGILGLIGAGSMYPEVLREHIQKCKKATDKPFGVNVPMLYPNIQEIMDIIVDEGVKIVSVLSYLRLRFWSKSLRQGRRSVYLSQPLLRPSDNLLPVSRRNSSYPVVKSFPSKGMGFQHYRP